MTSSFQVNSRRRHKISDPAPITRETLDLTGLQKPQGHKYDHGHALVFTGGPGRTGAGRLAGRAALRIGAGAVTLAVPPAAQMEVAQQITALMLARVADAVALEKVLEDGRINVLCLGPGMGLSDEKHDLIKVALKSGRACVLDADALTLIAQSPTLFALVHPGCVITPHGGEFLRLFPEAKGQGALAGITRAAAEKIGCTVLLKGAETVIATPEGACWQHLATETRAAPWLATAGSGDVLAGFITGLMARGFDPGKAACHAALLHVECALAFGPGLIAEDLAETLPYVLREHL